MWLIQRFMYCRGLTWCIHYYYLLLEVDRKGKVMISTFERLGARMLSRLVPSATAAAGPCSCIDWWCCDAPGAGNYCYCVEDNGTCYVRYGYTLQCPGCTGC